jgi:glycine/D-amino acid oxidase-like deaminating enzyme
MSDDPAIHDLLVVGGGINGAGIARDAAGRGLRTLLCEQHVETAAGGVGGNAGAVDATADDDEIVNSIHHGSNAPNRCGKRPKNSTVSASS